MVMVRFDNKLVHMMDYMLVVVAFVVVVHKVEQHMEQPFAS